MVSLAQKDSFGSAIWINGLVELCQLVTGIFSKGHLYPIRRSRLCRGFQLFHDFIIIMRMRRRIQLISSLNSPFTNPIRK